MHTGRPIIYDHGAYAIRWAVTLAVVISIMT